ncbi:MAG: hypothetical protein JAZ15_03075 [Candidatus Thiodiazotropha endolucinida]|nr:hypothetical protein [Candidatus Thiodiazotropha taylori]MCW4311977.1 hypothetical protein [Candidatus Thiodiazotropha taylori]
MRLIRKIEVGVDDIHGLDFSTSGNTLIAGVNDALYTFPVLSDRIQNVERHEEKPVKKIFGHNSEVMCVKQIGDYLYTTSNDASCIRWILYYDESRPQFSYRFANHQELVTDLDVCPDGTLATCSHDGSVILWGTKSKWGDVVKRWDLGCRLHDLRYVFDGQKLMVSGWDASIHMLDVGSNGSETIEFPLTDVVTGMAVSYKRHIVVGAAEDRHIRAYDMHLSTLLWDEEFSDYVWRMAVIDEHQLIVAGCGRSIIGIDLLSGKTAFDHTILDSGHFNEWIAVHYERKMVALAAIESSLNGDYRGQNNIYVFQY